jgi:hypothetical protein
MRNIHARNSRGSASQRSFLDTAINTSCAMSSAACVPTSRRTYRCSGGVALRSSSSSASRSPHWARTTHIASSIDVDVSTCSNRLLEKSQGAVKWFGKRHLV